MEIDWTLVRAADHLRHPPASYPVVLELENSGATDMEVWLEMVPESVILSPGHRIELLARPHEGLLPLDVEHEKSGWVVHAAFLFDPDWHVRFKGHLLKPGTGTRLDEFEDIEGHTCVLRHPFTKAEIALSMLSTSGPAP